MIDTSGVVDERLGHVALRLAALAGQVALGRRVGVVQGRVRRPGRYI